MSYAEELRTWANERVADYERNRATITQEGRHVVLGEFKSNTSDSMYKITMHAYGTPKIHKGNIRCNCPGFTFRRNCRHIKEYLA